MAGKAGTNERGDDRRRTRQHLQRHCRLEAGLDQAVTGIGNAGHARITDHGDGFTRFRGGDQISGAARFVVLVQRNQRLSGDPMMREQGAGVPRILAGNPVRGAQDLQRPQGDISKIPDRRRDQDNTA